jgi:hypothetical protein
VFVIRTASQLAASKPLDPRLFSDAAITRARMVTAARLITSRTTVPDELFYPPEEVDPNVRPRPLVDPEVETVETIIGKIRRQAREAGEEALAQSKQAVAMVGEIVRLRTEVLGNGSLRDMLKDLVARLEIGRILAPSASLSPSFVLSSRYR